MTLTKRDLKQPRERFVKGKNWKPLWDLGRDGLTQGAIELFLECREQFRLKYLEGWSSKKSSDALEFGSCFHDVLARIQSGETEGRVPPTLALAMKEYRNRWRRERRPTTPEWDQTNVIFGLVEMMLPLYLDFWKKIDSQRVWECRERVFKAEYLLFADGIREQNNPNVKYPRFPLTGRWDGLFWEGRQLAKPGKLWLHEMKTKGRIDEVGIQQSLPFDLQTMLYCWAARETYGVTPAGVVYDLVKQPGQRMTEKSDGMDPARFIARVKAEIEKTPAEYFMRFQMTFSKDDLDNFIARQLDPILRQIHRWHTDLSAAGFDPSQTKEHFLSGKSLFSRFGSRSDYFDLITKGNSFGLFRRKHPFPELQD